MIKIWFIVRLSALAVMYVMPRFLAVEEPSVSSAIRLGCFQILALLLGAVTFVPSGRRYILTTFGKIEMLGFVGLIASLALALWLTYQNRSPYLGVLFGGVFVAVPFLVSLLLASAAGVAGILNSKSI